VREYGREERRRDWRGDLRGVLSGNARYSALAIDRTCGFSNGWGLAGIGPVKLSIKTTTFFHSTACPGVHPRRAYPHPRKVLL